MTPGDLLTMIDMAIAFISSKKNRAEQKELSAVRAALKNLRFSDETIERLASIPDLESADALIYTAHRASTKQRDTRAKVHLAFDALEAFGQKNGLSIKAGRLIDQIENAKLGVRHEIELAYFNAIKNGTKSETKELVEKIRKLNAMIEELDAHIDSAVLAG